MIYTDHSNDKNSIRESAYQLDTICSQFVWICNTVETSSNLKKFLEVKFEFDQITQKGNVLIKVNEISSTGLFHDSHCEINHNPWKRIDLIGHIFDSHTVETIKHAFDHHGHRVIFDGSVEFIKHFNFDYFDTFHKYSPQAEATLEFFDNDQTLNIPPVHIGGDLNIPDGMFNNITIDDNTLIDGEINLPLNLFAQLSEKFQTQAIVS